MGPIRTAQMDSWHNYFKNCKWCSKCLPLADFFQRRLGRRKIPWGRRLGRRKIARGVHWDVGHLFGASIETSEDFIDLFKDLFCADRDVGHFFGVPTRASDDYLWHWIRCQKIAWGVDWDAGKFLTEFSDPSSALTMTSNKIFGRRLGRRKIAWGVDLDVGKKWETPITPPSVIFMPEAKDRRPLGWDEVV